METRDRLSKYYISFTNVNSKIMKQSNMKLKYDYTDRRFLVRLQNFTDNSIPSFYDFDEQPTINTFIENLCIVISMMDNDKVNDFFGYVCSIANLEHIPDLAISDSKSQIVANDGDLEFNVQVPERRIETDAYHAAIAHELTHFSLFLGKDRSDIFEYSEVLPFFIECMMYKAVDEINGEDNFINNRLSLLKQTFEDIKDDLFYACNPHYLGINEGYYSIPLASNLSYPEGLEFVLQLLDRRKENSDLVDNNIGGLLLGQETIEKVGRQLDIKTDGYPKILKLIK